MKRKICIFMVVFFLILLGIGLYRKHNVAHSDLYLQYQSPYEDFYGKELYAELDHQSSPEELEFGEKIADKVEQVMNYSGTREDAVNEGALNEYYYFYNPYYSHHEHLERKVELLTCKMTEYTADVWIGYGVKIDDDGWNAISLINLRKAPDGEWVITWVREMP